MNLPLRLLRRLPLALLALLALPRVAAAQDASRPPPTSTPSPQPPPATVAPVTRPAPFASFDNASPAVRDAVAAATTTAQTATTTLDEAFRLGIISPVSAATPTPAPLPPAVEALPAAVTRANSAIVAESRATRATELSRRDAALARLRAATTEADRQRIIEELRTTSGQRLEAQREDARLVRDRLRQLRDLTTLTRPSGN